MQEIAQPEPYVLSYGDQLFLIIDCVVVTNVDVELLPLTLLLAYFVFNIKYPKGCFNLYSFWKLFSWDKSKYLKKSISRYSFRNRHIVEVRVIFPVVI